MSTTLQLSPETEARLADLASRTGQTKEFHLREIVEHGLEEMEDYYRAIAVRERIARGEEDVLAGEEFWRGVEN